MVARVRQESEEFKSINNFSQHVEDKACIIRKLGFFKEIASTNESIGQQNSVQRRLCLSDEKRNLKSVPDEAAKSQSVNFNCSSLHFNRSAVFNEC